MARVVSPIGAAVPPYRSRCLTSTNKRGMSDARRFQQQTRSSRLLASPEKNPGVSHPLGTLVALKAVSRDKGDARMREQIGWELRCGMDRYFLRLAHILQESSVIDMDLV